MYIYRCINSDICHPRIDCIFVCFKLRRPEFVGNKSRWDGEIGKITSTERTRHCRRLWVKGAAKKRGRARWDEKERIQEQ